MKTKYKHIHFEEIPEGLGIGWECFNNKTGDLMATIEYYKSWRKYAIAFTDDFIYDASCLRDIADFLAQLDKEKAK